MNFDGRNEVRVNVTVTDKIIDKETGNKRIKADIPNGDGQYDHNVNVPDDLLWQVLTINNSYDITISRGNGMPNGRNNTKTYGYFWKLIEIHQEQAPVAESHIVQAAIESGAKVISETPERFKDWREVAEERKQKSIERQQLIVFANQILTDHDKLQIEIGNGSSVSTTINDRLKRIKAIAQSLEPHFATGFQEQVLTEEVGGILKEELFPPVNEPPRRSDAELRALLDQPSQYEDLNNPELR